MKKCEICQKINKLKRRTCSYDCYMKLLSKAHAGQKPTNLKQLLELGKKSRFEKGHIGYKAMLGKKQTQEAKELMSKAKKKNPTKYWLGKKRPDVGAKIAKKLKGRKLPVERIIRLREITPNGSNHKWWKGGLTNKNTKIRNSSKYSFWRRSVFERDNYTCQICMKKGKKLQADHIKQFALYPKLRFSLDNGRTLCIDCHKNTDTYLKGRIKRNEPK
jgi:hypothetical protein